MCTLILDLIFPQIFRPFLLGFDSLKQQGPKNYQTSLNKIDFKVNKKIVDDDYNYNLTITWI